MPDVVFGVESLAYAAIRAVQFVAITGLLGVLAFRLVVLPRFMRQDRPPVDFMAAAVPRALGWARAAIGIIGLATVVRLAAMC